MAWEGPRLHLWTIPSWFYTLLALLANTSPRYPTLGVGCNPDLWVRTPTSKWCKTKLALIWTKLRHTYLQSYIHTHWPEGSLGKTWHWWAHKEGWWNERFTGKAHPFTLLIYTSSYHIIATATMGNRIPIAWKSGGNDSSSIWRSTLPSIPLSFSPLWPLKSFSPTVSFSPWTEFSTLAHR